MIYNVYIIISSSLEVSHTFLSTIGTVDAICNTDQNHMHTVVISAAFDSIGTKDKSTFFNKKTNSDSHIFFNKHTEQ